MSQYGPPIRRRRRQLSLDGVVPGIEFNRHRGGLHYAGAGYGHGKSFSGRPPEEYDPVRATYPSTRGYDEPESWDPPPLAPDTPLLRFERESAPPAPEEVGYGNPVLNALMIEHAWREVLTSLEELRPPECIPFDHDVRLHPLPTAGADWTDVGVPESVPEATYALPAGMAGDLYGSLEGSDAATDPAPAEPDIQMSVEPSSMLPDGLVDDQPAPGAPGLPTPSLEQLVEQLAPPDLAMPSMPDPLQDLLDPFNQPMFPWMDPFNMPGPMG